MPCALEKSAPLSIDEESKREELEIEELTENFWNDIQSFISEIKETKLPLISDEDLADCLSDS